MLLTHHHHPHPQYKGTQLFQRKWGRQTVFNKRKENTDCKGARKGQKRKREIEIRIQRQRAQNHGALLWLLRRRQQTYDKRGRKIGL